MLHRTEALLKQGIGPGELHRMVEHGDLVRVRRGVYADVSVTDDLNLAHLTRARAAALILSDNKVFSHQTAGVLHQLPVWRPSLARVAATRAGHSGGRKTHDLIVRASPLRHEDVMEIEGCRSRPLRGRLLISPGTSPAAPVSARLPPSERAPGIKCRR